MDAAEAAWDERPMIGNRRGLPWWGAVLLPLLLTTAGAVIDKGRLVDDQRLTGFGLYHALFLAGCLLAVVGVQRRNLFGPMVQPPLIFAVTFIPVQFMAREAAAAAPESGTRKLIFEVALPLASSFPWMAGATAATIVLGAIRLFLQRNPDGRAGSLDADEDERPARRPRSRNRAEDVDDDAIVAARRVAARERDRSRAARDDRAPGKRDQPPTRRPAREQDGRRDRGENPPRRNPQRPRDQGGGRPRGSQQQPRRRPREDY
nr:hypothetical protein [Kibdelosporangium sp. MJ126-NF4]CTQ95126.1 hypothetical protein [Kibdelosporangium sp. MJ126-NF4]